MRLRAAICAPVAVMLAGAASAACSSLDESSEAALTTVETAAPEQITETAKVTVTQQRPAEDSSDGEGIPTISDDFRTDKRTLTASGTDRYEIVNARAGTHPGFDRVVIELAGSGSPSVMAQYTDQPSQPGSGFPLDVAGNATLQLVIHGLDPFDTNTPYDSGAIGASAGRIKEINFQGSFEGDSQWFIGLDSKRPFAIGVLDNPTRVVVDFQT